MPFSVLFCFLEKYRKKRVDCLRELWKGRIVHNKEHPDTMKTAHFIKGSKKIPAHVIISDTLQPIGPAFPVSGKKEAGKIAKEHGAKPWNF